MKKTILFLSLFFSLQILNAQVCLAPDSTFPVGSSPSFLTSADFNTDGNLDLAVSNPGSNNISVLLGTGTGSFTPATNYTVGTGPSGITQGDFDNDGNLDIAIANNSSNNITILNGLGNGNFSFASNVSIANPYTLVAGDLNNDSILDLVTTNYSANNVSIFLGLGNGSFAGPTSYSVGPSPQSMKLADFNMDGKLDLAVSVTGANSISFFLGLGNGTFGTMTTLSVGTQPYGLASGDFNEDGKLDLLTGNMNSNDISVLLGNGNGTFAAKTDFPAGTSCWDVTTADFNLDGHLDVVATNAGVGSIRLFLGIGNGTFGSAIMYFTQMGNTFVVSGDFNNDSKTDLATANSNPNNASVKLNLAPSLGINCNVSSICPGSSAVLTGTGASSFLWNTGQSTPTITVTPTSSTNYTITDNNGCGSASYTVNVGTAIAPSICMVTVDDSSKNNVIYWDESQYLNFDSMIIYRETISNTYKRIGAVSIDSLSQFTDTVRVLYFPFTGDPNTGTYRYKLRLRDTCGNYSALGPYHNTIYSTQTGGTFNWNDYQIEGQATPISQLSAYYLYRDDNNTWNWTLIGAVSGSQLTINDPNYLAYPNANWRIETLWSISCTPTLRYSNASQGTVVKSRSNVKNNRTTGNSQLAVGSGAFSVFPNPASTEVTILLPKDCANCQVEIVNALGETVKTFQTASLETKLNISDLTSGVYFVKVKGPKTQCLQKIMVQR